jgi:Flp pilus assembly protein TadG
MTTRLSAGWVKLCRLGANISGTAALEFALGLPMLLGLGMWGAELGNIAMVNMQVSQLAMQIADNGSRIGDTSMLQDLKIYESDINDLLNGANIQGNSLDIFKNGRVIISSLQVVPNTTDKQYILWQRCKGARNVQSRYGVAGTGLTTNLVGMGPAGSEITAGPDDAVIFVEIEYVYQPLISAKFAPTKAIRAVSAFNVRDDRDITQIYQRDSNNPDAVASCSKFTAT